MKINLKEIKNKVGNKLEQFHYESKDAAPWLKFYDEQNYPKTINYPECTIYEMLEKAANEYPEYDAYEYFGKKVSYADFTKKIKRCAQSFQKIGVTADDTVTILMPNTPEGVIAFYACNMLGAVANMVHPLSSEGEIEFCLNKAKSNYILTMDFCYEKLYNIRDKVMLKRIILASVSESMPSITSALFWVTQGRKIKVTNKTENVVMWADFIYEGRGIESIKRSKKGATDLAVILYSGGTTGTPKGIMHSSRTFNVTALQNRASCPAVKPGNSVLSIMPIFHGFGLAVCFHTILVAGMKAIIVPKFTPAEFGKLIKTYKPNFIIGVPTLYEALLQTELKADGLSFVSTVLSGGDMLTPELQKKVDVYLKEHGCPTEIRVGYGMTECVAAVSSTIDGNFVPSSIGIPFPDNYIKIVKTGTTENIYYDEDGEICVHGPSMMLGYLDEPEETANTIKKHDDGKLWVHTGDMGCMNKDGMLFFKSRIKRMIISSGYNVYPNHIENVINSHPKVLTSIVVGVPHPYKGEVAKAFVVLKPEFEKTDEIDASIKALCQKNLSKYMLPTTIEYRETLPKTKIGKADYRNVK